MSEAGVHYAAGAAEALDIERHLRACDHLFHPPLSSRVDLATYASKLAENAQCVQAWEGDTLAGLVAGYLNIEAMEIYISNVSVLKSHAGHGIASHLLQLMLQQAKSQGCTRARLEVSPGAAPALRLYGKLGFAPETAATPGADRWILTRTI